jgi:hypothetical protein
MRFLLVLPLAILLVPLGLAAQVPTDSVAPDSVAPDSASPATGTVLRAVELARRDIFDPDARGWVARLGNAIHFQTRAATIRRELLFRPGEPFDSARVAESERNLRALGIFRRVRIDSVRTDSGLVARVLPKDGWSTKADWRFRSTGGEVAFTIGRVEDNLLGTASSAAVRYRKTPDRTSVTLAFAWPSTTWAASRPNAPRTSVARACRSWFGCHRATPAFPHARATAAAYAWRV